MRINFNQKINSGEAFNNTFLCENEGETTAEAYSARYRHRTDL